MLEKPTNVKILEVLHRRMRFEEDDEKSYWRIIKGFEGECEFYEWLKKYSFPMLILYDLFLTCGISTQLDFVIITANKIFLLDVKNFKGDYHYRNGEFYTSWNEKVTSNPITQLNRGYNVLEGSLKKTGMRPLIEKKLIFINPEFTLYGNQPDLPIVLRSQLNEYLKSIESQADPLQNYPHQVAAYLEKIKLAQNPYEKTPKYSYEMLDKGILCKSCGENHLREGHRSLLCSSCGLSETKSSAIERMIEEYRLLFPDRKFTPTILKEWCGNVVSLDLCGRVLRKYLRSN